MELDAQPAGFEAIASWRDLYRQELNCQIIHDSIHSRRGWSAEHILNINGTLVGYGSVAIAGPWKEQPSLYEFYVLLHYRSRMFDLFATLLSATGVKRIETQSNDPLLTCMLHAFARDIVSESILYHDKLTTSLAPAGAFFRTAIASDYPEIPTDRLWSHGVIETDGAVAAKGGILFHYNRPYGDIYMEVAEPFRKRGFGSYLVQELKRVCYERGNIPSARCNPANIASRKTLQKAGFVPCGHILVGTVVRD